MGTRYLALLAPEREAENHPHREAEERLLSAGMLRVATSNRFMLFRSADTVATRTPGDGALIGEVFHSRSRTPGLGPAFGKNSSTSRMIDSILDQYWGEYLLLLPDVERPGCITILRDPSGAVPCVYSTGPSGGFITSDISLAVQAGLYRKNVAWEEIPYYLAYPHIRTGRTALKDVHELLPGSEIRFQHGELEIKQAWSPWKWVAPENRHRAACDAAADVGESIRRVIGAFAPVDEPILLELSGGLDSSIIAACLSETGVHSTCQTLVTPVPGADERLYAGLVARHFGFEIYADDLSVDHAAFDFQVPVHSVAPGIGPLQYAIDMVMQSSGERHKIKCYYSGGGGDTVFSYLKTAAPAADALIERGLRQGLSTVRDLSQLHQCTYWKASRLSLRKLFSSPKAPCRFDRSFLSPSKLPNRPPHHPWFETPVRALPGDRERIFDLAGTQIFRDCFPRGDKRKIRMPLLSQPVVEACLRVPSWMWIEGGGNRTVARAAFKDTLPVESISRRSKGTFLNYLGVVYQGNKNQMREYLTEGELATRGFIDRESTRSFMSGNLPPRDQSFTRVLELCMIENWIRNQI